MVEAKGLMKPVKLKSDLAEFLGEKELPRTEITKKLWVYIKKNKLQTKSENGKPENAGKFIVAGTWGNEKRSCSWAARRNTEEERCEIEIVVEQCPITCKVPCQQPRDIIVAGATSAEEVEPGRKGVGFLIVGCTLLGVAALALIVLAVVQEIKDRGCTATSVLLDLFHIRKGDKETSDDELSKQSSLDLNANEDIELTMSGSVIIESATLLKSFFWLPEPFRKILEGKNHLSRRKFRLSLFSRSQGFMGSGAYRNHFFGDLSLWKLLLLTTKDRIRYSRKALLKNRGIRNMSR